MTISEVGDVRCLFDITRRVYQQFYWKLVNRDSSSRVLRNSDGSFLELVKKILFSLTSLKNRNFPRL